MITAEIERITKETSITAKLSYPETSEERKSSPSAFTGTTGIGFFDHMLNSFCVHGGFTLEMNVSGDLKVDGHHTVEDAGIVIGSLFLQLREKIGDIERFGDAVIPMDEALASAVVDVGGRPFIVFDAPAAAPMIGDYDTQLTAEFFRALAFNMKATLHLRVLYGDNDHHKVEALFKAAAHAIAKAYRRREGCLSAKGIL